MIKFSIVICLSTVLLSSSAKPYKPREHLFVKELQDTVVAANLPKGKVIQRMKEVEPSDDKDVTHFEISREMLIGKAVKVETKPKYNLPEEDNDALYHSIDIKPPADLRQSETYNHPLGYIQVRKYDKPEEDRDDIYHREVKTDEEPMRGNEDETSGHVRPIYLSPEEDKDVIYHPDVAALQSDNQPQTKKISLIRQKKVHTEPEVDMDELYHKQR
ncbi:hypothetical protein DNTS_034418 [Danionella cerebrum]|uniref:Uncharacterized protein n=1 Tax=Danionella cerebrum TaxID=2873325 RepID=A0A553MQD9_9TELE|nr:hypothetical protein DNTS_034418 [Danionella translucida]